MRSKQRQTETAFGSVDYETVECSSCGTEVEKESAHFFVTGSLQGRKSWSTLGHEDFEFKSGTARTGWACEYCQEDGPISFPNWGLVERLRQLHEGHVIIGFMTAILLLLLLFQLIAVIL